MLLAWVWECLPKGSLKWARSISLGRILRDRLLPLLAHWYRILVNSCGPVDLEHLAEENRKSARKWRAPADALSLIPYGVSSLILIAVNPADG